MAHKLYWYLTGMCLLLTACGAQVSIVKTTATAGQESKQPIASVATELPLLPPESCPITRPAQMPFKPPAPYPANPPPNYPAQFWYGSNDLWTMLYVDGTWSGLPLSGAGYTQKLVWWRDGYDMGTEPNPKLTVSGKRLDGQAAPMTVSSANGVSADFGEAMMVGVEIPTPGCWEISGQYKGHELSFVVWVVP